MIMQIRLKAMASCPVYHSLVGWVEVTKPSLPIVLPKAGMVIDQPAVFLFFTICKTRQAFAKNRIFE
jgi:hypothetical protein